MSAPFYDAVMEVGGGEELVERVIADSQEAVRISIDVWRLFQLIILLYLAHIKLAVKRTTTFTTSKAINIAWKFET